MAYFFGLLKKNSSVVVGYPELPPESPEQHHNKLVALAIASGEGRVRRKDLPIGLPGIKFFVKQILAKYTHPLKFSIFGHHHDNRMRAVMRAIQNATGVDEIERILERQLLIVNLNYMDSSRRATSHGFDRKNRDIRSDLYKVANTALPDCWQKENTNLRQKTAKGSGYGRAISDALFKLIELDAIGVVPAPVAASTVAPSVKV